MEHRNDQNENFSYTYSATQQEEIRKIRAKYQPQEEDKMAQLLRMDRQVTQKGNTVALILGILGALVLGVGMCCVMVWQDVWFIPGIVIGSVGIILVLLAYPAYVHITKKERERIAPEIIRLTDELMK